MIEAKEIDVTKESGTHQEVIHTLFPEPMENSVKRGANIKITFDTTLKEKSAKNSIDLKYLGCQEEKQEKLKQRRDKNLQQCASRYRDNKNLRKSCRQCAKEVYRCQKERKCKPKHIKGKTTYHKNRNLLKFNPRHKMRPGYYQVTTKGLKTVENEKIKTIKYRFEVSKNSIESIALLQEEIQLEETQHSTLNLQAIHKDGSISDITENINWIVGDTTIVSIDDNGTVKALKAGETLIQAEYHGKTTKEVKVTITAKPEIINGYTLPPEPDPKVNNATLLGVDSNDNGVRDDVERKIIKKYPKKIQVELLFDGARVFQQIMEQSIGNARDLQKETSRLIHCDVYLMRFDSLIGSDDFLISDILEDTVINTPERVRKYLDYNIALSGGNSASSPDDWNRGACSAETIKVLEEMGL